MITEAEKKAAAEAAAIKSAKESLDTLSVGLALQACKEFKHLEKHSDTFDLHVHRYVAVAFLKGSAHPEMLADASQENPTPEVRVANKIAALKKEFGEQAANAALLQQMSELEYREEAIQQIKDERAKEGTSKGGFTR